MQSRLNWLLIRFGLAKEGHGIPTREGAKRYVEALWKGRFQLITEGKNKVALTWGPCPFKYSLQTAW